jgi:NADH:ubiquinone oxidoreductase subunit 6 (subunit J)
MSLTLIIFYLFAAITVLSALAVLVTRNVLYAAFALLGAFLGVAALYVLAGADFVAVTQLMIYVGGVLVLLIFGVMMTNRQQESKAISGTINKFLGFTGAASLFVVVLYILKIANFVDIPWLQQAKIDEQLVRESTIPKVGIQLMTDFVLPFELAGILLLLALLGAAFIAGYKDINKL